MHQIRILDNIENHRPLPDISASVIFLTPYRCLPAHFLSMSSAVRYLNLFDVRMPATRRLPWSHNFNFEITNSKRRIYFNYFFPCTSHMKNTFSASCFPIFQNSKIERKLSFVFLRTVPLSSFLLRNFFSVSLTPHASELLYRLVWGDMIKVGIHSS